MDQVQVVPQFVLHPVDFFFVLLAPAQDFRLEHWVGRQRDENEDRDNLGFSHIECDLCGALPGDRHAVTALPENPADNPDYIPLSVCEVCMYYIASGDLPDYVED